MKFAVSVACFIASALGAQVSHYGKDLTLISEVPVAAPAASPAKGQTLPFSPAPAPVSVFKSNVSLEDSDAVSIKFLVANYDYNQIYGQTAPPAVVEEEPANASNEQLQWVEGNPQKKGVVLTVLRRSGRDAHDTGAAALMEDAIRDAINAELAEAGHGPAAITVLLSPGESRMVDSSDPGAVGRSLKVEAFFGTDVANNKETMKNFAATLEQCYNSGSLTKSISVALFKLTGLDPQINEFVVAFKDMTWSSTACQSHMTDVVHRLTVAYTRRMVPASLFWECTNYMVQLSFSHDRAVTSHDRKVCQRIVAEFSANWNFGQSKAQALPVTYGPMSTESNVTDTKQSMDSKMSVRPVLDMSGFCKSVCEVKFGIGAVLCQ